MAPTTPRDPEDALTTRQRACRRHRATAAALGAVGWRPRHAGEGAELAPRHAGPAVDPPEAAARREVGDAAPVGPEGAAAQFLAASARRRRPRPAAWRTQVGEAQARGQQVVALGGVRGEHGRYEKIGHGAPCAGERGTDRRRRRAARGERTARAARPHESDENNGAIGRMASSAPHHSQTTRGAAS